MKKTFLLCAIIIALLFVACEKEKEFVTYSFTSDDRLKLLLHYIEGKFFSFGDDERKFKVIGIRQLVRQNVDFAGKSGTDKHYFYYEEKQITLEDYESGRQYTLRIRRYPINVQEAEDNPYKKYPSRLSLNIDGHRYPYNVYDVSKNRYSESFSYGDATTTLSANGLTFTKVHILDRSRYRDDWQGYFGSMFNEAYYTYFDEDYGIVGFDSFAGTQLRLENK